MPPAHDHNEISSTKDDCEAQTSGESAGKYSPSPRRPSWLKRFRAGASAGVTKASASDIDASYRGPYERESMAVLTSQSSFTIGIKDNTHYTTGSLDVPEFDSASIWAVPINAALLSGSGYDTSRDLFSPGLDLRLTHFPYPDASYIRAQIDKEVRDGNTSIIRPRDFMKVSYQSASGWWERTVSGDRASFSRNPCVVVAESETVVGGGGLRSTPTRGRDHDDSQNPKSTPIEIEANSGEVSLANTFEIEWDSGNLSPEMASPKPKNVKASEDKGGSRPKIYKSRTNLKEI